MEHFNIRTLKHENELEAVLQLLETVFPEEKSFFQDRLNKETNYSLDTTWIAESEGNIVSVVQIFPFSVYISGLPFKTAGIGNVAILPEYRGFSLTHRILKQAEEQLSHEGFVFSILFTGIPGFYEKAGWHSIAHPVFHVDAKEARRSFKKVQRNKEWEMATPNHNDWGRLALIYESFSKKLNGPRIRLKDYWLKQIESDKTNDEIFLLAEYGGRIRSYARAEKKQNKLIIHELCGVEGGEDSMSELFLTLLDEEVEKIVCLLPQEHPILSEMSCRAENLREDMWKIINKKGVQHSLEPILKERGRLAGKKDVILSHSNESWKFRWGNEELTIHTADFLSCLLKGASEQLRGSLIPFETLFPEASYIFWSKDHF
ncbi:GNAT family N-acetyltransferase [Fictibacillus sp. NRS-1165]|uniref:GNAT family N-acetyltransferase n=1 Tax=Fictibacillus sp. NRS-1165 TaxID=3144463 RepID=UPI003D1D2CDB